MNKERSDTKISLSTISLWPWATLIAPSELTYNVAKMYEFDGLEIHPGLTVVREFEKKGCLNIPDDAINSIHQTFKTDQRIQRENSLKTEANATLAASIRSFIIWNSFPSESRSFETTKGIEKYLGTPVIIHWTDETDKFKRPTLEVHQDIQMSPKEICNWAEASPDRGLAVDLSRRKFWSYLNNQNIRPSMWKETLASFLPYITEVHFQISDQDEVNQVTKGNIGSQLGQTLHFIKEAKPEVPIVVEAANLKASAMSYLGRRSDFYSNIVNFIRKA